MTPDPSSSEPSAPEQRATPGELHEVTRSWWLVLLTGAISVVVGAIVLAKPNHSLTALVVICGIFIVLDSVLELVAGVFSEHSGAAALLGVLGVVIGILLIRHPVGGVLAATLLVGLWFVAIGVIRLISALTAERRLWRLIVAALEIVAGIVLVASPHIGFATLALLIGISFVVNGIALLAFGTVMRGVRRAVALPAQAPPPGAIDHAR